MWALGDCYALMAEEVMAPLGPILVTAVAQALPFGDDEFDTVISAIGVMFAPDHRSRPTSWSACAGRAGRSARPRNSTLNSSSWRASIWPKAS